MRRITQRVLAALALAAAMVATGVGVPSAAAVAPTTTSFFLDGEYGDTLVGPLHASFIAPSLGGTAAGVNVVVAELGHTWTLQLQPAIGGALGVGSYTDVMKAGTQTGTHPGLDLAGNGTTCPTVTGTFIIDQIAFDGSGDVTTLVARWEIHCGGAIAASFGGASINGTALYRNRMFSPHSLTFTGQAIGTVSTTQSMTITNVGPASLHITSATLTDTDASEFQIVNDPCSGTTIAAATTCVITVAFAPTNYLGAVTARLTIVDDAAPGGEDIVLKGTALPSHRGMVIDGETGDIPVGPQHLVFTAPTVTGDATGLTVKGNENSHNFTVDLSPPLGQQLSVGTYEAVVIDGSQTANRAGLSVHGDGRRCTTIAGRFIIDDLAIGSNGQIRRLSARWEQHCEQGEPANFGIIDFDGNAPFRDRSVRTPSHSARATSRPRAPPRRSPSATQGPPRWP